MTATPSPHSRAHWLERLFPRGVPGLWCGLLVHALDDGRPDIARTVAHLRWLRSDAQCFTLSSQSMGLGRPWASADWQALHQAVLRELNAGRESLLLEVHGDHELHATTDALTDASHRRPAEALIAQGVCGLALSVHDAALPHALALGWPVAAAHRPFPSDDGSAAAQLAAMAQAHENLLYFIETGDDAIARSGQLPAGVFRVRASAGDYTASLASTGGLYHGLKPVWASAFPSLFAELILAPALGQWDESRAITARLQRLQAELLAVTQQDTVMALLAVDDLNAHGSAARLASPLHDALADVLAHHDLLAVKGYVAS